MSMKATGSVFSDHVREHRKLKKMPMHSLKLERVPLRNSSIFYRSLTEKIANYIPKTADMGNTQS